MELNGYEIVENPHRNGRRFELRNAAGKVVKLATSMGRACRIAESMPTGDCEPQEELDDAQTDPTSETD